MCELWFLTWDLNFRNRKLCSELRILALEREFCEFFTIMDVTPISEHHPLRFSNNNILLSFFRNYPLSNPKPVSEHFFFINNTAKRGNYGTLRFSFFCNYMVNFLKFRASWNCSAECVRAQCFLLPCHREVKIYSEIFIFETSSVITF